MTNETSCIFCKISKNLIYSEKFYENDSFFVISDIKPQAPIHLLVISIEHVVNFDSIPLDLLPEMHAAVLNVCQKKDILESGYRLIINTGQDGGQEVPHFHLHILAGEIIGPIRTIRNKGGDI